MKWEVEGGEASLCSIIITSAARQEKARHPDRGVGGQLYSLQKPTPLPSSFSPPSYQVRGVIYSAPTPSFLQHDSGIA